MKLCIWMWSGISVTIACVSYVHCYLYERPIVIITASYNNEEWYRDNLDSILMQRYRNYRVMYIDDCSSDNTYTLVKSYLDANDTRHHVTLIRNSVRYGALANQYNAIHTCNNSDIIIILDGDDRFAHNEVLSCINQAYSEPAVWMSYGQFKSKRNGKVGFCCPMPPSIVKNNAFRNFVHIPSHVRTFYAGLFKRIQKEDLMYEGEFFHMCADIATMFPMIEMAREKHFKFIPDILLEYNDINQLNDHRISMKLQRKLDEVIRNRPRYNAIDRVFEPTLCKNYKNGQTLLSVYQQTQLKYKGTRV